ncbi:MAG: 23S rRNA (uracil(1939)-C(5))-methyltransferase RlmD [Saprospiraceae bacterium]|nr:23S rRNA (uracil(1939)-C(5))-methyltransferase RlmD [Saprospiraceae bacterium]
MARRRKNRSISNLSIEKVAAEGKGLGRLDSGKVVFVDYALPGDVVNAFIYKRKKDVSIARINEVVEASPDRIDPFCSHFQACGGCRWQHAPYAKQLEYKQNIVREAFERIGKVKDVALNPIVGADNIQYYRNKLEFTFSNKRWLTTEEAQSDEVFDMEHALGFHVPTFFDKIVDIDHCYLQPEPSNAIRLVAKAYALEHDLAFYDIRNNQGLLRTLIIRTASNGEVMVILNLFEKNDIALGLLDHLAEQIPAITSLNYVVNNRMNNSIQGLEITHYKGQDHIVETIGHCQFRIAPASFFQTNTQQATKLYELTAEYAALTGNEIVYDLFTGTGTIANFVAKDAQKVVGIEIVEAAIEDAKKNTALNENDNCFFYAGKVEELFDDELLQEYGAPDVIILDPPRAGIHKDVVAQLLKLKCPKIVYVSCNPATQARDVDMLSEVYQVEKMQPVDMFPHTYHVENVALLTLR